MSVFGFGGRAASAGNAPLSPWCQSNHRARANKGASPCSVQAGTDRQWAGLARSAEPWSQGTRRESAGAGRVGQGCHHPRRWPPKGQEEGMVPGAQGQSRVDQGPGSGTADLGRCREKTGVDTRWPLSSLRLLPGPPLADSAGSQRVGELASAPWRSTSRAASREALGGQEGPFGNPFAPSVWFYAP